MCRFTLRFLLLLVAGLALTSIRAQAAPEDRPFLDLQVTKLTVSNTKVELGGLFLLRATIANFGDQPAHNVYISVAATTKGIEVVSKTPPEAIPLLDKGEKRDFEAKVRLKEPGKFKVGVIIMVGDSILAPPHRWVEVEVTQPPPSPVSLFIILGITLGSVVLALILGFTMSKTSRRNKAKKAIIDLIAKTGSRFALSHREIALTLTIFLAICMVFFAPETFPSNPSPGVFRWIMRVYYPVRLVAPLALVTLYGLRVHKPWPTFLIGFCPLLLLALTELSWKPLPAIMMEDLYFGVALGIVGVGWAMHRQRSWIGGCIVVLGLILLFSGGMAEGILWYVRFLLGGSLLPE